LKCVCIASAREGGGAWENIGNIGNSLGNLIWASVGGWDLFYKKKIKREKWSVYIFCQYRLTDS